ncbi:MAG: hypothetical protein SCK57_10945 [Bacillota bacterium]|nr:hypothetical protein [Bacillota bacterium]MDW7678167.1 hypothetical protein [Bacillota bacterium]
MVYRKDSKVRLIIALVLLFALAFGPGIMAVAAPGNSGNSNRGGRQVEVPQPEPEVDQS